MPLSVRPTSAQTASRPENPRRPVLARRHTERVIAGHDATPTHVITHRDRSPGGRRGRLGVMLVLGSLTAMPAVSVDMYSPALPQVTSALHSTSSVVQLTLTACLAGLALGQLVVGPLSDTYGRRRPLLVGLAVYLLATLGCALAPTAGVLVAARLLQGLAGAAAVVIARAIVRDLYDGLAAAKFFSNLMLISGVAPIAAPLIGGQLLRLTSWRGVFVTQVLIGAMIALAALLRRPETLPPERRHRGGLGESLRSMRAVATDRIFMGYVLTCGIGFGAMFAYIAGSPFVVEDVYHATPQVYSLLFGVNSVGLVAMGQLNGRLVGRVPMRRLMAVGLGLAVAGSLGVLAAATHGGSLLTIAAPLFVMVSSMGLIMPNGTALGLERTPNAAGAGSALLGTFQFLIGAVTAPIVGLFGSGSALPMAVIILVMASAAVVLFVTLCRPERPAVEPAAVTG